MTNLIIAIVLVAAAGWFFVANTRRKITNNENSYGRDDDENNYEVLLNNCVPYYQNLNENDRDRFAQMVTDFLNEVNIEGVELVLTNEDRIMVAASAIIPIFGFPEWKYNNLTNVLLYPDTFNNDFEFSGDNNRNIMGLVGPGFMNGQMILSRAALQKGFAKNNGSENAAVHEFVHLVDGADGEIDGIPEVHKHGFAKPWLQMMHSEMHRIKNGRSDINPYALTNEAEFLAVAGEYFFDKPDRFKAKHPELYSLMSEIFSQTP